MPATDRRRRGRALALALAALAAAFAAVVVFELPVGRVIGLGADRCAPRDDGRAGNVELGCPLPGDRQAAARVRRSPFEPRPANAAANRRVPSARELAAFRAAPADWGACAPLRKRVTGRFTGTTDEIIQWAAWKWGIDEDLFRAAAVQESQWRMGAVGDGGLSFGLMQVKRTAHPGTFPLARASTAFNADYYGATVRHYLEGCATWLNEPCCRTDKRYGPGDLRGSIGAWYSGRWHENVDEYLTAIDRWRAERRWRQADF